MKGAFAFNRRGTVHEWEVTASPNYRQTKCSGRQVFYTDVQTADHQLKGLPLCKRCFPEQRSDQ